MPLTPYSHDVIIIGAGPAGCAAARLLAAWGHRALIIDRPAGESRTLGESIPPSARKTLGALGVLAAVDEAGFQPWRGNTVWWADEGPRAEWFAPDDPGYQVVRRAFDRLLCEHAVEAGAEVRVGLVRDARIPALARDQPLDGPPAVVVETECGPARFTAPFVLDASGRAGSIARQGLRRVEGSHHTVALVGLWQADAAWPDVPDSHTLVASYADGWAWSVATAPRVRYVAVMVDPQRTDLARGGNSAVEVYRTELAKARPFHALLERATLVEGPWGADASLYSATAYAGPGFLLVGDAASFIDPLSSFGVKKALASGWLAAIASHTALVRPAMQDEALAFYDRRERTVYASYRKQAARFAAEAAAGTPHAFWLARAGSSSVNDEDEQVASVDTSSLSQDPAVTAAFQDLRSQSHVRLRAVDNLRLVARAAIRGREIVLEDHLVLPQWPNGIRYLRGVDLLALMRHAPAHTDVGAMYEAYVRSRPTVILPDFLGALSVLIAGCVLRHD